MLALILLFVGSAFATSTNTIQNFSLTWNPNSNQLGVNLQCKAQEIAVLTLSNGMERTIICPTIDFGSTWLIGEQTDSSLTGTVQIQAPCDICSRTSTISLYDAGSQSDGAFFNMVGFGVLFVIVILIIGFAVSKLQR